jgi:hypothetical protein
MNITRNPATKKRRELRMKIPCSGTSCASAGEATNDIVANRPIKLVIFDIEVSIYNCFNLIFN